MSVAAEDQVWVMLDKPGVELYHTLLTFRAHHDAETGMYEAECVELGVPSFGDSLEEAMTGVTEATVLYLNTIEEFGERARVFAERGIDVERGRPPFARSDQVAVSPGDVVSRRYVGARDLAMV